MRYPRINLCSTVLHRLSGTLTPCVAIDVTFACPYALLLIALHDPVDFHTFAATTTGALSPSAHALISLQARQRAATSDVSERILASLFIT